MATQLCGPSETTPTIGVVPYSTTVARQPEKFDSQHHSSFTSSIPTKLGKRGSLFPSSALERVKAKKFGLKLVHRLLRRSRIDCATGPGRYDGIFSEHVDGRGATTDEERHLTASFVATSSRREESRGTTRWLEEAFRGVEEQAYYFSPWQADEFEDLAHSVRQRRVRGLQYKGGQQ